MASIPKNGAFSLYSILFLVVASQASNAVSSKVGTPTARRMFDQWMARYKTSYSNATEKERRFEIFQENLRYVEEFNGSGNRTYQLGLNEFSDLTTEELLSKYTGNAVSPGMLKSRKLVTTTSYGTMGVDGTVPDSVDWVARGALNDIQDQGTCSCCWAFSAAAAMEAVIKIKTGVLKKLSEQQLLDCDTVSHGCTNGWFQSAFQFVVKNGGISLGSNYPYVAKQGNCNTAAPKAARIDGWKDLPQNDEAMIMSVVARQPVSVLISGLNKPFMSYKSGIFTGEGCGKLDHAVVIVGYGTSADGTKYWKIRNSWGPYWGEGGYMRIAREIPGRPEGACGLAQYAAIPY